MIYLYIQINKAIPGESSCLQITIRPDITESSQELIYNVVLEENTQVLSNSLFKKLRRSLASLDADAKPSLPEYKRSLKRFGVALYDTILWKVKDLWMDISNRDFGGYILDVDPSLWEVPWELLFHSQLGFLDKISRPIIRQIGRQKNYLKTTIYINKIPSLYFLGADPIDHATRANEQFQEIETQVPKDVKGMMKLSYDKREIINSTSQWLKSVDDLMQNPPDIFHIVAHGVGAEGFAVEGKSRSEEVTIGYDKLVEVLMEIKQVKLLIIAVCESGLFFENNPEIVKQLFQQTELEAVLLMASDISADAIINFTKYFYNALWQKLDVAHALSAARSKLRSEESELFSLQWSVPMLYEKSSLNPFKEWLEEVRDYTKAPPIPFECLETAQVEAKRIQDNLSKLTELCQQVNPASSRVTFMMSRLQLALGRYEKAMDMFNKRYMPDDESLLDSIRVTNSKTIPVIDQFLKSKKSHSSGKAALSASRKLVEHLNYAVELVQLRASTIF